MASNASPGDQNQASPLSTGTVDRSGQDRKTVRRQAWPLSHTNLSEELKVAPNIIKRFRICCDIVPESSP
ncbi:hypothetical protein TRIP_E160105 [uncultured Spirochaetota bacterium]|nr:hypothetical protein TRIP_E160105 [uncultured Spirochaetota bacterium]